MATLSPMSVARPSVRKMGGWPCAAVMAKTALLERLTTSTRHTVCRPHEGLLLGTRRDKTSPREVDRLKLALVVVGTWLALT